MDLSHRNTEGLTKEEVTSVLENRGVSPERIMFFLNAYGML